MTRNHISIRQKSALSRRRPLLGPTAAEATGGARFAEVAGVTAADCAAVACCFPCGLLNLLVLALYKLPASLCRRVTRRRRRRKNLKKKGMVPLPSAADAVARWRGAWDEAEAAESGGGRVEMALQELEKEMWDRFYGAGFWRSSSQRDT